METPSDVLALEQQCVERARRSVNWLVKQQAADGGCKALPNAPMDAFYKAAWAFGLMGEAAAAERSLDYVKRHFLQPDGNFLRGFPIRSLVKRIGFYKSRIFFPKELGIFTFIR